MKLQKMSATAARQKEFVRLRAQLAKSGTVRRTVTDTTLPTGALEGEINWYAPFTRCDRETDYATVWRKLEEKSKS